MSFRSLGDHLLDRAVLALLGLVIALLGAGFVVLGLAHSDVVTVGAVDRLLDRAVLAVLGHVITLLGTGLVVLGLAQTDAVTVGPVVAAVLGVLLIVAGVRQIFAAVRGRRPKWYEEFVLFAGGVIGQRPRART